MPANINYECPLDMGMAVWEMIEEAAKINYLPLGFSFSNCRWIYQFGADSPDRFLLDFDNANQAEGIAILCDMKADCYEYEPYLVALDGAKKTECRQQAPRFREIAASIQSVAEYIDPGSYSEDEYTEEEFA